MFDCPRLYQTIYYRTAFDCLATVVLPGSNAFEAASKFCGSYGRGTVSRIVRIEPAPNYRGGCEYATWA